MKPEENILVIVSKSIDEFDSIPNNDWIKKDNPQKWSKIEILGHLIDSATTNLRRFIMTQYQQHLKIVYHQDQWVDLQKYQKSDIKNCIELWRLLNLQIIRVIKEIPEATLQNVCDTGKETVIYHTLEFLIDDYIEHLKHHLNQITNNRISLP